MTARNRLKKAMNRLNRMRDIHPRLGEPEIREEFLDWTEDCLIAMRSVSDHLLQEGNERFSLGIRLEDRMSFKKFKDMAENQSNDEALSFVSWIKAEMKTIRSDRVLGPLIEQRHLTIHRIDPGLTGNVDITDTIHITDSVSFEIARPDGTVDVPEPSPTTPSTTPQASTQVQVYWTFDRIPDIDVLEACELLYSRMERLVDDAETRYS